jgi:hypothetical protein
MTKPIKAGSLALTASADEASSIKALCATSMAPPATLFAWKWRRSHAAESRDASSMNVNVVAT